MKTIYIFLVIFIGLSFYSHGQTRFNPDDEFSIETEISFMQKVHGEYGVWYKNVGSTHPEHGILTKPVIICEGIDFTSEMDFSELYEQMEDPGGVSFLRELRNQGYDIVILNLLDNTGAILKNSRLFIALLEEINSILESNGSNRRSTVIGVSMGGLVTSCALKMMEDRGDDHDVELLITYDTPHKGANVPLGVQHFADFWLHTPLDFIDKASKLDQRGLNPIDWMNEMLLDKHGISFVNTAAFEMAATLYKSNWMRKNFLDSDDHGYPDKCRKVAVSCGGGHTDRQAFPDALYGGEKIMEWTKTPNYLVDHTIDMPSPFPDITLRWKPVELSQNSSVMPGNNDKVFEIDFSVQSFINMPRLPLYYRCRYNNQRDQLVPPADPNIDHVPGGTLDIPGMNELADNLDETEDIDIEWSKTICVPAGGIQLCTEVGFSKTYTVKYSDIFGHVQSETDFHYCFVPSVSALDISTNDWFYDIASINNYPYTHNSSLTPFDAIQVSNSNHWHAYMNHDLDAFLEEEIAPSTKYIQNREFQEGYHNTFEAGDIVLGRDVDIKTPVRRTPVGDVIIKQGAEIDLEVPADDGSVSIYPGFTIEKGGTFSITTNPNLNSLQLKSAKASLPNKNEEPAEAHGLMEAIETSSVTDAGNPANVKIRSYVRKSPKINNRHVINRLTNTTVYPNPINSKTFISFNTSRPGIVKIYIVNNLGIKVKEITDQVYHKGHQVVTFNASSLEKGLYTCYFESGKYKTAMKLVK